MNVSVPPLMIEIVPKNSLNSQPAVLNTHRFDLATPTPISFLAKKINPNFNIYDLDGLEVDSTAPPSSPASHPFARCPTLHVWSPHFQASPLSQTSPRRIPSSISPRMPILPEFTHRLHPRGATTNSGSSERYRASVIPH